MHTHSNTHILSVTHTHTHSLSLSHTHTHTHARARAYCGCPACHLQLSLYPLPDTTPGHPDTPTPNTRTLTFDRTGGAQAPSGQRHMQHRLSRRPPQSLQPRIDQVKIQSHLCGRGQGPRHRRLPRQSVCVCVCLCVSVSVSMSVCVGRCVCGGGGGGGPRMFLKRF
jgi:hypothetical protein